MTALFSLLLLVVGCAVIAAAWLTPDRMWSRQYWIDRLWGNGDEADATTTIIGGVNRGMYLLGGVVLVLLGILWPWMANFN